MNKVFSFVLNPVCNFGVPRIEQFFVPVGANTEAKLKSVFFDLSFRIAPTQEPLNISTQEIINYQLLIGNGTQITNIFIPGGIFTPPLQNGNAVYMIQPGQIYFDSFIFNQNIPFVFYALNFDPVNDYTAYISIMVETIDV